MKKYILMLIGFVIAVSMIYAVTVYYEIDQEACTSCGICLPVCPEDAIHFDVVNFQYYIDPDECTACGDCEETCNNGAINIVVGNQEDAEIPQPLRIYPNPARESVNIELQTNAKDKAMMEIFNAKGQLVFSQKNVIEKTKWNLKDQNDSSVASGFYYLKVSQGDQVFSDKIMVIK